MQYYEGLNKIKREVIIGFDNMQFSMMWTRVVSVEWWDWKGQRVV